MIAGVVLAAGESRRMGRSKALVSVGGQSFLARAIRLLWVQCGAVVVVLGKQGARVRRQAEEEFARLAERGALQLDLHLARHSRPDTRKLEVQFVENRAYRRGMYASARLGLAAALRLRAAAVLLSPVDHPAVLPATVRALGAAIAEAVKAYRPSGKRTRPPASAFAYAIIPRYRGRRGHPVALSAGLARAIAKDHEAHDLSDAIRRNARLVGYLDVKDRGVVANVNRPTWRAR